jgi:hypothetical protein
MAPADKYVDRRTAVYFETLAQVQEFELARFREFYDAFLHERIGQFPPLKAFIAEGADSLTAYERHPMTPIDRRPVGFELKATFFGEPGDDLITGTGALTTTAHHTLERIQHYRDRIATTWNIAHLGLLPANGYLEAIVLRLHIGRRSLGHDQFDAFRATTQTLTSLDKANNRTQQPLEIRTYDSFIDSAAAQALSSYPHPNQEFVKTILRSGAPANVIQLALSRLAHTAENEPIFEYYLPEPELRSTAINGIHRAETLRPYIKVADGQSSNLLAIRIAAIENDQSTLTKIAMTDADPRVRNKAIGAMTDCTELARVRAEKFWDGRTERETREALVDARLAFLNGDATRLAQIANDQQTARWAIREEVLYITTELLAQQQSTPEVFISYRHESAPYQAWAKKLATDLRTHGINALLDQWEISPGDSIADYAATNIAKADAMLFIITEAAVAAVEAEETTRSVLKFEFQIANARRYRDGNFKIIGILRSGQRPPNHIADSLYLDFRQDEQYDTQLTMLVNGLTGTSVKPAIAPVPRHG